MPALRKLLGLLLAALALLAPAAISAKPVYEPAVPDYGERILHFLSDITVSRDATLQVTESITVRAENDQINRGIYRDFPTRYERGGRVVRVGFEVDGVERDGRPEPWTLERISNGIKVRIGDPDIIIDRGRHTYTIRYRTTRQLGFFDGYDELYWNVTGNDWAFPIDRAEARIRLPSPATFGQRAVYTGPQGSTRQDATVVSEQPGEIFFRTMAPLGPQEGLTVAVAWPKGIVTPPPPPSATQSLLEEYGPLAAALLALFGLAAYYYHAWRKAGRGPVAGTVVPLFEPPEGMSAAALRYVQRMGYDNRTFAAAIVESGVKGQIRLVESDGGWFSGRKMRIEKTGDGDGLASPERGMLGRLFNAGTGHSIEMDKKHHATFRAAQSALSEKLAEAYKGKLFLTNLGWAFAGLMLVVAAMLFVGAVIAAADPYAFASPAIPFLGLGLALLAVSLGAHSSFGRTGGSTLLALLAVALALAAISALVVVTFPIAAAAGQLLPLLAPLLALPLVISAFWWMSAPTREGRQVMDRIAGFERYLSITEEERFETLHPPEKTPELFERYLPHAIALGVENRWASRFAGVLAAASAAPDRQGHRMAWYSGSQNPWSNPGGFAAAMGGTLASTVASASTAPGSRSGSGGGGSSGGGGGGGGGGGW